MEIINSYKTGCGILDVTVFRRKNEFIVKGVFNGNSSYFKLVIEKKISSYDEWDDIKCRGKIIDYFIKCYREYDNVYDTVIERI